MEGTSGKLVRLLIVALLLYSAYTVATCPCVDTELLACKSHGELYYGALAMAIALVPIHHGLNQ
jgi:hypothetical protein